MNKKKKWYELFEESLRVPKVIDFMNQMAELGAGGGKHINCFVYHKNSIVLVANYRAVDDTIIGAILSDEAYNDLMMDIRESTSSLPLGYFAWAYRYGWDFLSDGLDVINAFKKAVNQGITDVMNRTGAYFKDVMFLVREYVDAKMPGEYGLDDSFDFVGIFNDVHEAEKTAAEVLSEETRTIYESLDKKVKARHDVAIIPVYTNYKYPSQRPSLGGSWYVE